MIPGEPLHNQKGTKMKEPRSAPTPPVNLLVVRLFALLTALGAPLGLYWALKAELSVLAMILFTLTAIALLVGAWVG